jgi:3-hydroxybutyrate dehydrogenase
MLHIPAYQAASRKVVGNMLKGRTALVTGSTSGIGLAVAEAFAVQGANVIINGLGDARQIETIRANIETTHGVAARFDGADMSRPDAIEAMMRKAIGAFGAIDVLVNNAGIQHVAQVEQFPIKMWDAIMAINLTAAFHTIRHALPAMKAQRWGRIINVASAHALVASPFKSAYVAAKHGLAGLTKTVALEAAEHGVTVNAICPGYVLTPLVEKQIPDTAKTHGMSEEAVVREVLLAAQPTKQFITVEQVAAFATFLASDAAASITAAILPIDGGWTAH